MDGLAHGHPPRSRMAPHAARERRAVERSGGSRRRDRSIWPRPRGRGTHGRRTPPRRLASTAVRVRAPADEPLGTSPGLTDAFCEAIREKSARKPRHLPPTTNLNRRSTITATLGYPSAIVEHVRIKPGRRRYRPGLRCRARRRSRSRTTTETPALHNRFVHDRPARRIGAMPGRHRSDRSKRRTGLRVPGPRVGTPAGGTGSPRAGATTRVREPRRTDPRGDCRPCHGTFQPPLLRRPRFRRKCSARDGSSRTLRC